MKKREHAIYLASMVLVLIMTFVFSFAYFTRSNIASADVVSEQINHYGKKTEENSFATITANDKSSAGIKLLNDFFGSLVINNAYTNTNKFFITDNKDGFKTINIPLASTKIIHPGLMILPAGHTPHNFFDIPLIAGSYRELGTATDSSYYISKSFADKIIENQTINAINYEELIDKKIKTLCRYLIDDAYYVDFSILGVLDDSSERTQFYKSMLGEDLCIAPYNSILYYFNNVSYVFEVGNVYSADSAFIGIVEERLALVSKINPQYSFELNFYEKNEEGVFVRGQINNAYIAAKEYINNLDNGIHDLRKQALLVLFLCSLGGFIIFTFFLMKKRAKELMNPTKTMGLTYLFALFGSFILVSFILLSIRGLQVTKGVYIPFSGSFQAVSALAILGIVLSFYYLIGNLFLIIDTRKRKNIAHKDISK